MPISFHLFLSADIDLGIFSKFNDLQLSLKNIFNWSQISLSVHSLFFSLSSCVIRSPSIIFNGYKKKICINIDENYPIKKAIKHYLLRIGEENNSHDFES